ncbi:MAG: response regulator [Deltaproteobacteria bacterium]|nr:response regulator [Deltaproteobacteria bacterium]
MNTRVVLAEDDDDLREVLAETLTAEGYDVAAVSDGLEARRLLRDHPAPDLLIIDLRMPSLTGWELRLEQRSDPELEGIPVIAMSADRSAQAAAIDADAFLAKPFTVAAFLDLVRAVLARVERERARTKRLLVADRMSSLGMLAAGVGHEINNPLAYVLWNLDYVADALRSDARREAELPKINEAIQEARQGTQRIRTIVARLRAFSVASGGPPSAASLERVLREAIAITAHEVRFRGVLHEHLDALPTVRGDETQLVQLFVNLLVNAAQALDGAPERHEIHVLAAVEDERWVRVEVRDTGLGIAPEHLPKIFHPFFSTKRGYGSGLGLAICRDVVESAGGEISADSRPGDTRFVVRLRRAVG